MASYPAELRAEYLHYKVDNKIIIDDISFVLPMGKNCLITGASGCGKTTLLSMLAGITTPESGQVFYEGLPIFDIHAQARDRFRGENIGLIFQRFHLVKALNVIQNIEILQSLCPKQYDKDYAHRLIERLGLEDKKQKHVSSLSVGEQQRLALIRCLVVRPKWLLCDEPTSALDDKNTDIMLDILQNETQKIGTSLVIVTHDKRVKDALSYHHHLEMGE